MKLLGTDDSINVCDCCGKSNLKYSVTLETDAGDIVHYGSDCAGAALYGRKNRKNGRVALERAQMVDRCMAALPVVKKAIAEGQDPEQAVRKVDSSYSVSHGVYQDTGNPKPLRIFWGGYSTPGYQEAT